MVPERKAFDPPSAAEEAAARLVRSSGSGKVVE